MRTATLLALLIGCGPAEADCLDGRCCEPWTTHDVETDRCVPHRWRTPGPTTLGDPGARQVELAIDDHGGIVATWVATAADQPDSEIVIAEPQDGAWHLWTPARGWAGFGLQPVPAGGRDGRAIVAWKQQEVDTGRVFVAERDDDSRWSIAGPLSWLPTAYEPRPVMAPSGETLLVWNQFGSVGYGVALARRPAEASSSEPLRGPSSADDVLSPAINFSNAPQLVVNARGDALVTWYQSNGGPLAVYVSERFGPDGAFSRPSADEFLSPADTEVDHQPVRNPSPALANDGQAAVVWTHRDGHGRVGVLLATRDREGRWTVPRDASDAIARPSGRAFGAFAAFDADGRLWLAWCETTEVGTRVHAAMRDPESGAIDPIALAGREHDALAGREHDALTRPKHDALAGREHDARASSERDALARREHDALASVEHDALAGREHDALTRREHDALTRREHAALASVEHDALAGREHDALARPEHDALASPKHDALASSEHDAFDVRLAVGDRGEVLFVWSQHDGEHLRVLARRNAPDRDALGPVEILSDADDLDAHTPVPAIGRDGRAAVAWIAGPWLAGRVQVATLGPAL